MGTQLRRRPAGCAAAAAAALLLGACLPGGDADEGTSTSSSATEPTREQDGGEGGAATESFDSPEQQELDAATARQALPTASDLPGAGWEKIDWAHSDSDSTYDPAECAALGFGTDSAEAYRDKHRTVSESAAFGRSGSTGGVEVYLESYATPYPLAYFDEAGESLGACGEYTVGGDVGYTATAIPPPLLGERAFGVRISAIDRHRDLLFVRSGHNLINIVHTTTDEDFDERLLEKYAQGVLEDLERAS